MIRILLLVCALGLASASATAWAQPTLQQYVEWACHNNPVIVDNKNQSQANILEADRLKAQYTKPLIGVTGNYLVAPLITHQNGQSEVAFNSPTVAQYNGYDLGIVNGLYQGLLNVTMPVLNEKRYSAYANQATTASYINDNNAKLTAHDIEKSVTDQYILCLQDEQQWNYTDSLLALLNEQTSVVKRLVESGLLKQSDLSLISIELQTQKGLAIGYRANYKRDLLDLNVLCGIPDTTTQMLLPEIDLSRNPKVKGSAFLKKYALDSLNLSAQRSVFELKYKPIVNMYANGGVNAITASMIPQRLGMSAGINFSWTIFDGGQRKKNAQKIDHLMNSVRTNRNYLVVQNTSRLQRIQNELQGTDQRLNTLQAQLKEFDALLSFYKKELMRGQLSVINYINTLKNFTTVKRDYVLLQTNRLLLINLYNYYNW